MNTFVIVILVVVALAAAITITYVLTYNKIQKYMIRINEAESQIDEALRKKYDILVSMENIINETLKLKQNNFSDLNDKDVKISNFDMDRRLTKTVDLFKKIRSDYLEELDFEAFRTLLVDLKINEEKNDAAKKYYNKYTTQLNMLIKRFPSNIIAKIHSIKEHLYFDNKDMSDDDILDFKL